MLKEMIRIPTWQCLNPECGKQFQDQRTKRATSCPYCRSCKVTRPEWIAAFNKMNEKKGEVPDKAVSKKDASLREVMQLAKPVLEPQKSPQSSQHLRLLEEMLQLYKRILEVD